jgi:ribonuclease T1
MKLARAWPFALALVLSALFIARRHQPDTSPAPPPPTAPAREHEVPRSDDLPPEARVVLERIRAGGHFEHRQDGGIFQNREGRLPARPRGYYREYTVETPGSDDRGARRLVTGGDPPVELYYSDDHYRSFRRLDAR